jgi:putative DNA primase/helicase
MSRKVADLRDWIPDPSATAGTSAFSDPRPELESDTVVLVNAATIMPTKIVWSWYGRLARRVPTWLEGPPDMGKSTMLADLAARVSRGDVMPGEVPRAGERREAADVIVMTAEDSLDTTTVPRLIAHGADLNRIHFLTATRDEKGKVVPFRLSDDGERLARKAREVNAGLIEIDPLVCFTGSRHGRRTDSNNDLEVRQALQPLSDIDAAVIAIRHFRKSAGTDPLTAGGGSVAYTAVARIVLATLKDPQDSERYLLAISKNNLIKREDRKTLSYSIVPSDFDPEIGRILWGDVVDVSAEDVLQAHENARRGGQTAEAERFIRDALAAGPVLSTMIEQDANARGISRATLWRARKDMPDVGARKIGRTWSWFLKREREETDETD